MSDMRPLMRRFCTAWSRVSHAYCSASNIGVKDSMLWLLYALDDGESHSQKSICEEWYIPKTTLNTTIKQAEREGYLTLTPIPGKRREMAIQLTEYGRIYAVSVLAPVYEAEEKAMSELMKKYPILFVDAMSFYAAQFEQALDSQLSAWQGAEAAAPSETDELT
ncbi:MAG: MarR family transcriptional regulator [Clostridia bacterium]|nr:MarR family transcriptional regulator [Clostridia bacterium]